MMYESPIDVFVTQLNVKRREFEEKQILEAVQGVGVNVNRRELEKALQYDRKQYEKGYVDGVKEFADRLKGIYRFTDPLCPIEIISMPKFALDNLIKEMLGDASG